MTEPVIGKVTFSPAFDAKYRELNIDTDNRIRQLEADNGALRLALSRYVARDDCAGNPRTELHELAAALLAGREIKPKAANTHLESEAATLVEDRDWHLKRCMTLESEKAALTSAVAARDGVIERMKVVAQTVSLDGEVDFDRHHSRPGSICNCEWCMDYRKAKEALAAARSLESAGSEPRLSIDSEAASSELSVALESVGRFGDKMPGSEAGK